MADLAVNTKTGVDGSEYTTSISNDKLTNQDFLKLMIEELKQQDPTKPMDSQRMLDTQMQMSSMETNLQMTASMKSLESAIANMSLSSASALMGKKIDAVIDVPVKDENGDNLKDPDGNTYTEKVRASFLVNTVEIQDGTARLESHELLGFKDRIASTETGTNLNYNYTNGQITDSDGTVTDYYVKLDDQGRFDLDANGKVVILDAEGEIVTPKYSPTDSTDTYPKFGFSGTDEIYAESSTFVNYEDILKIY
ncbi:MAG: hypothetical protein C0625_01170 [Arcobacter sp.]|nr:MAG: hypothetical protein C0625_01170 [Arcobacter sp.]